MDQDRRNFLKGAGIVAAVAATGGFTVAQAETKPVQAQARGYSRHPKKACRLLWI